MPKSQFKKIYSTHLVDVGRNEAHSLSANCNFAIVGTPISGVFHQNNSVLPKAFKVLEEKPICAYMTSSHERAKYEADVLAYAMHLSSLEVDPIVSKLHGGLLEVERPQEAKLYGGGGGDCDPVPEFASDLLKKLSPTDFPIYYPSKCHHDHVKIDVADYISIFGGNISGNIIDFCLKSKILNSNSQIVYALPVVAWPLLNTEFDLGFDMVKRCVPNSDSDFLLVIPINRNAHWLSAVIRKKDEKVEVFAYNSLKSVPPYEDVNKLLLKIASSLCNTSVTSVVTKRGPTQNDSSSCAVFVIKFLEQFIDYFLEVSEFTWKWPLTDARSEIIKQVIRHVKASELISLNVSLHNSILSSSACVSPVMDAVLDNHKNTYDKADKDSPTKDSNKRKRKNNDTEQEPLKVSRKSANLKFSVGVSVVKTSLKNNSSDKVGTTSIKSPYSTLSSSVDVSHAKDSVSDNITSGEVDTVTTSRKSSVTTVRKSSNSDHATHFVSPKTLYKESCAHTIVPAESPETKQKHLKTKQRNLFIVSPAKKVSPINDICTGGGNEDELIHLNSVTDSCEETISSAKSPVPLKNRFVESPLKTTTAVSVDESNKRVGFSSKRKKNGLVCPNLTVSSDCSVNSEPLGCQLNSDSAENENLSRAQRSLFQSPAAVKIPVPTNDSSPLQNFFTPTDLKKNYFETASYTNETMYNLFNRLDGTFTTEKLFEQILESFEIPLCTISTPTTLKKKILSKLHIKAFKNDYEAGSLGKEDCWEKVEVLNRFKNSKVEHRKCSAEKELAITKQKLKDAELEVAQLKTQLSDSALKETKTHFSSENSYIFFAKSVDSKTSGLYSRIVNSDKLPKTDAKDKTLRKRAINVWNYMKAVQGTESDDEVVKLVAQIYKSYSKYCLEAAKVSNLKEFRFAQKMSPEESLTFYQTVLKTKSNRRTYVRAMLNSTGFNPLVGEKTQNLLAKSKNEFVMNVDNLEYGEMYLKSNSRKKKEHEEGKMPHILNASPEYTYHPYVKVKSIVEYATYIFSQFMIDKNLDLNGHEFLNLWKGKIIFVISADHGGDIKVKGAASMKFNLQVLNHTLFPYGLYEGSDCTENQLQFHQSFFNQFDQLQKHGIIYDRKKLDCILLCKGDMKQSATFLGTGGAAGSYPNLHDLVPASHFNKHKDGSPHNHLTCFLEGSEEGPLVLRKMDETVKEFYKNVKKNGKNTSKNQKYYQNVKSLPMIPLISPDNLVIGVLHAKMVLTKEGIFGISDKCEGQDFDFKKRLDRKRKMKEIGEKQLELAELEQEEISLSEEILDKMCLIDRISSQGDIQALNQVFLAHYSLLAKNPMYGKGNFPWVCTECILSQYDDILWGDCDNCFTKYHLFCLGKTEEELSIETSSTPRLCKVCRPAPFKIEVQKVELEALEKKYSSLQKATQKLDIEIKQLEEKVKHFKSEKQMEFEAILKTLGIDIQSHFSGSIIGNHCDKALDNISTLVSILPDEEDKTFFTSYFECIKAIIRPCSRQTWFESDDEIIEIEQNVIRMGELYPKLTTMKPKVHTLIFHLVPFLKKYRTIGFFSEEDCEKIHAEFNQILRSLACVRNGPTRLLLAFQRLCLKFASYNDCPELFKPREKK